MSEPQDPQGLMGLGGFLGQAEELLRAQAEAASTVFEGSAGGGAVTIEVTGGLEFQAVHIAAGIVDSDDPSLLEDLVLAALHDAMAQIAQAQQGALGDFDLGSLDLGGLGEMLGEALGSGGGDRLFDEDE